MVASFIRESVVTDTENLFLAGLSGLRVRKIGTRVFIYAVSEYEGGLNSFEMLPDGAIVPIQSVPVVLQSSTDLAVDVDIYTVGGKTYLLPSGRYSIGATTYQLLDDGTFGAGLTSGAGLAAYGHFATSDSMVIGTATYIYASRWNAPGFHWFQAGGNGSLVHRGGIADTTKTFLRNVSDIETAILLGKKFLFTASDKEPGIQSYIISSTGKPVYADNSAPTEKWGYSAATVLESAQLGNRAYVVMGSFGSGTLTVFSVSATGMLTPVDHLVDTRDTRFDQIQALTKFSAAGRIFLLAGGGDDGVTLLQLSPYGKLSVLAVIADDFTATLDNVSSIQASVLFGYVRVIVGSSGDGGFTSFRLDLGNLGPIFRGTYLANTLTGTALDNDIYGNGGNDKLLGGAGDDRLNDGTGSDQLAGGPGRDIFEFADDGLVDRIMDFEPGIDRIDLSEFALIYHFSELQIVNRSYGYDIRFGDDLFVVNTAANALTEAFTFGQKDFVFG